MSTIAKFLAQPVDNFSTQIASSTIGATDLSIQLDSASGLPTEGVGQLFKKDSDGNIVAGSIEFIHWTGVSSNTITLTDTGDRGITGSDSGAQSYVADDYFEVWASTYYVGGIGGLVEHNATGTHKSDLVTTLKAAGSDVTTGTNDTTIVTPKALRDGTLTNQAITTPTLILANTSPTADGSVGFDRTGEDLQIGDGSASQIVHMGVWTAWVPTFTGFSADPANGVYYYTQIGKLVICTVAMPTNGTSNATTFTMTAPTTTVTRTNAQWMGYGYGYDNTSTYVPQVMAQLDSNDNVISLTGSGGGTAWTNSGGKRASFTLIYETA